MREWQIRLRHRDDGGFCSPFLIIHDNLPWWQPKRTSLTAWWDLYSSNWYPVSYLPTSSFAGNVQRDQIRSRYFLSFYFSFADLEHEIWATITVSWILLFGLIVYPFSGAVNLSPALKSAATPLLELMLCVTFRRYWTGNIVVIAPYFQKSYWVSGFFRYWRAKDCKKVCARSKRRAMEGS